MLASASLQSSADLAMQQAMAGGVKAGAAGAGRMANMAAAANDAAIDKAAHDFEGMFMAQMLQPMWEGVQVDDTFGGGHAEEMMRGMMVQEYGKAMAVGDHSGLADSIKSELLRQQNHGHSPASPRKAAAAYPASTGPLAGKISKGEKL